MAGETWDVLRTCVLMVFLAVSGHSAENRRNILHALKHYETLSYDRASVLKQHQRIRRHIEPESQVLHVDFKAFQKTFHLRLRRHAGGFAEDFRVLYRNESHRGDLSHVYSGVLEGDAASSCQGSVLSGQFEGSIKTSNGTFYVESVQDAAAERTDHHSIIYHEDDIDEDELLQDRGRPGFCGADGLQNIINALRQDEEPVPRSKRTVDQSKTSCLLHLHADYLFFERFGSVEAVVAQVASYIRAVNEIYQQAEIEGIDIIDFKVKSLSVTSEEDPDDPLQKMFLGPEMLLSLYSETNWGNYCLSYLLTNRDFSGVLGLAWEGKSADWGGICSKHRWISDHQNASLNTGLITLQNFGRYIPLKFVQLTLAHELGHSLGSPHDEAENCGGLEVTKGKGRFLMFPHAQNEIKENSGRFSSCSLAHMSRLLKMRKDKCFLVSDHPICGNRIVEKGEECDIGQNSTDPCCYSSKEPPGRQCRLKLNKLCSPSQGLCCSSTCEFKTPNMTCELESECRVKAMCTGSSAACPKPEPKPNMTVCNLGTRVCLSGECSRSLCMIHNLELCDCPGEGRKEKCHMCCQQRGDPRTCTSTGSSDLKSYFNGKKVPLVPGAPCSQNQGYCDHFQTCRLLDADGPIARLKNSFLKLREFEDVADWMKARWWVILLAILAISAVMAGTVCLFGHTLEKAAAENDS